ncbi:hypothetical protein GON26_20665, partial [Flavobacterium sp. GA093]|nr:hypothetical protein [Flavobacterium hydrocarbonoxydans]
VSSTVDLQSAITGGTTHTFDNDGVNTLTSVVNGITEAAPAVNTVGNAITDATLTTTVNGVSGTALDLTPAIASGTVNVLANDGTNTITSTVNGKVATAPAVNTVGNTITNATLTTTVNGVSGTALDLTPAIASGTVNSLANDGTNTITSTVNGKVATAPAVNIVDATLVNGVLTSKVNGVSDATPVNVLATANSGLTATNGNVQLGGALLEAEAIGTTAANTLAITGLATGATTDAIVVSSTGGVLKTIPTTALATEPWRVQGGLLQATSNNDKIYQNNNVAIGKNSGFAPAALDVNGAIRGGLNNATTTVGLNSIAVGANNVASGQHSVAFGAGASATGTGSFALTGGVANGSYSIATATPGGFTNIASNEGAKAFGQSSTASGAYSLSTGLVTIASGDYSTAFGTSSESIGSGSFAGGSSSIARGLNSLAFGFQVEAANNNEVVFGIDNAIKTSVGDVTDPIFQIGIGTNNGLTILQNGNAAIGVNGTEAAAKPTERLDIGSGGVKIRDINAAPYIGDVTTDRLVVASTTGILKTITPAAFLNGATTVDATLVNGVLTSTVNGVADLTPVNVLSTANNGLTTTNGNVVLGGTLTASTTTITTNAATNQLAIAGLATGATTDAIVVSSTGGVLKTITSSALVSGGSTNLFSSSGNILTSNVNGISRTAPAVNAVDATLANGVLTSTVNGVADLTPVNVLSTANNGLTTTNGNVVLGGTLTASTTTITTNAATNQLAIAGLAAGVATDAIVVSSTGGVLKTITSSALVSGGSTNLFSSSGNILTSNVNGISRTAQAVNAVDATLANGVLTSTVNGVADLTPVNVLSTANSGLTATNGNVQLGGALLEAEAIGTTATNTLAITGLQTGGTTDAVVVSSTGGVLKTVPTSTLSIEPWLNQTGGTQATANNQNIYQIGNVAIGATTIPTLTVSGATVPVKFHVEGNMTTTGKLYTTSSVYADYVFDKYFDGYSNIKADYKFTPLNEVAAFVKANKHLPGVTPINEVSKDGIGYKVDMTTLTMQSLEKIEELYLHVIEQQKQIEAKDATIDTLKKDAEDMKARVARLEELLLRDNK